MINQIFFIFCLLVLFALPGCITSQDFSMLENRVAALEMENTQRIARESENSKEIVVAVKRVESEVENTKKSHREGYAELKSLIQEIREENRVLLGRLEESEHSLKQMGQQTAEEKKTDFARLDAAVSRNFQRLGRLEEYMGFEPSDAKNNADLGDGPVLDDTSEKGLYSTAKRYFDQDDFDPARKGFEAFLKRYPESDNADNARFWIAESYYREKWYEKAILEYQKVIENYSRGNKVAAALLKQGYAFSNLGEKANARLILKELLKKHPKSNEAKIAAEKLKTFK